MAVSIVSKAFWPSFEHKHVDFLFKRGRGCLPFGQISGESVAVVWLHLDKNLVGEEYLEGSIIAAVYMKVWVHRVVLLSNLTNPCFGEQRHTY